MSYQDIQSDLTDEKPQSQRPIFNPNLCSWMPMGEMHYRNRLKIPGIGGFTGACEWTQKTQSGEVKGYGLKVKNADGQTINFLHLKPGDPLAREEKYVSGKPLNGGRVTFGTLRPYYPGYPGIVYVTLDWRTALMLHRCKRKPSVACLFYENVENVVTSIAERAPKAQIVICFDGTDDVDDPKLAVLYGLSIKFSAMLIPSGEDTTFEEIYAQTGAGGLDEHLQNSLAKQEPWKAAKPSAYLENEMLPVPWPVSVSGRFVLSHLMVTIRRYISLSDDAALVISLWTILTYSMPAFRFAPLLALSSPEAGCGKSTLFYLLRHLCRMPTFRQYINANALKLVLRETDNALLIDEAQDHFRNRDIVALLGARFDRFNATVDTEKPEYLRRHKTVIASNYPTGTSWFEAVALAYRGVELPDRLLSRAVCINLQRKAQDDDLERQEDMLTEGVKGEFTAIRSLIRRWSEDAYPRLLEETAPDLGIKNPRVNDAFGPLLMIARLIGPEWEERAITAAKLAMLEPEAVVMVMLLLQNVREVLAKHDRPTIPSRALCDALCENEEWVWKAKKLEPMQLATMLRPYGLQTKPTRTGDKVLNQYAVAAFEDTFALYLPTQQDDTED